MLLANAVYEVDFAALSPHSEQYDLSTGPAQVESHLPRWSAATGIDHHVKTSPSELLRFRDGFRCAGVQGCCRSQFPHGCQPLVVYVYNEHIRSPDSLRRHQGERTHRPSAHNG